MGVLGASHARAHAFDKRTHLERFFRRTKHTRKYSKSFELRIANFSNVFGQDEKRFASPLQPNALCGTNRLSDALESRLERGRKEWVRRAKSRSKYAARSGEEKRLLDMKPSSLSRFDMVLSPLVQPTPLTAITTSAHSRFFSCGISHSSADTFATRNPKQFR